MFRQTLPTVFILSLCLVFSRSLGDNCDDAFDECTFRLGFSQKVRTYELTRSTKPFTDRIRSKRFGQTIGIVNSNGMSAEFVFDKTSWPVKNFGEPNYAPTHFKPKTLGNGGSAIAHQWFTGNQLQFAKYRCVRVWFSSYQIVNSEGNVKKMVNNVSMDKKRCVVFKTM